VTTTLTAPGIATPSVHPPRTRPWYRGPARFVARYRIGTLAACILLLVVLCAVFADRITSVDPLKQDLANHLSPPGAKSFLGTDTFGRDVWSRIVFGARTSLLVGVLAVLPAAVIGAIVGVLCAYFGGGFDLVVQRVVDTLLGFPPLVLALVMVVALGPSIANVSTSIAVVLLPSMIRVSRAAALTVSNEVYVLAAQSLGAPGVRIALRHVLPNSLAPVFVIATGALGNAILVEASLSFLGLGVPPPAPTWGGMLNESVRQGQLYAAPWLSIFPGLALCVVVFCVAFVGDALRDALDPRLRNA
jgi:peptide/nickel transport system permease protein